MPARAGGRFQAVAPDADAKVVEAASGRAAGRRRGGWPASAARWPGGARSRWRRCEAVEAALDGGE